ncbi:hypothetical protein AFCDBAGC_4158 [Methylobacterium cerastii]|uniref:Uncharacterized protein n=1 Tax=Methylobacterium cerastii TaxID=932741 RepID=A0ABQ4QM04_9HYPH|nr:hypothetical protein AFCDBAGC_4158 [Methylobacterium cerastii]
MHFAASAPDAELHGATMSGSKDGAIFTPNIARARCAV